MPQETTIKQSDATAWLPLPVGSQWPQRTGAASPPVTDISYDVPANGRLSPPPVSAMAVLPSTPTSTATKNNDFIN